MDYYAEVKNNDFIDRFAPQFAAGVFDVRADGKITNRRGMDPHSPWIFEGHPLNRNCALYQAIYAQLKIVHSRCQGCWKVVVRPKTLKDLIALLHIQRYLGFPAKCGIERRPTVFGLYGGYFYNDTLEDGRQCWEIVRRKVAQRLSPDTSVILKRGCTEFEVGGIPSDQWQVTDEQKELEFRISDVFDMDWTHYTQPPHLKDSIIRRWIKWAYAHGDETYLQFTDGKPLYPPYVTYHPQQPIVDTTEGSEA